MHLYIIPRGTKHLTDQFINMLQGVMFPIERIDPATGKMAKYCVQMNIKPLIPYELVFPEEYKDVVYNTLFNGGKGEPQHPKHKAPLWALQKALGVKGISDYDTKKGQLPLAHDHIEINAIGEKSDYWEDKDGKHYYGDKPKDIETHEGL